MNVLKSITIFYSEAQPTNCLSKMAKRYFDEDLVHIKSSKLSKSLKKDESPFSSPWKGSDAVLIVEDRELHVHTQTLSLASPVFDKMFNGNFKEAGTKKVTLEDKEYELVEHMLRLTYPFKTSLGEGILAQFLSFHLKASDLAF